MPAVDVPKVVPATAFGRRFRSTTEARWAVWLTEAGVAWEYEPETYDIGPLGWYLPDFWLPAPGWFLEVKPGRPAMLDEDYDKARGLHLATGLPVIVANGFGAPPWEDGRETDPGWVYDIWTAEARLPTAAAGGAGYRLFAKECGCPSLGLYSAGSYQLARCEHGYTAKLSRSRRAYDAALSFRPDSR